MSTANQVSTSATATSRASHTVNGVAGQLHGDAVYTNGHHHHHHEAVMNPVPTISSSTAKKGKAKKATDPNEASKLIAAKISQLELDAAGEKDQEAEIGTLSIYFFRNGCSGEFSLWLYILLSKDCASCLDLLSLRLSALVTCFLLLSHEGGLLIRFF